MNVLSLGCCTTCTAKLISGTINMDSPLGLLKDLRKQGYFLTCCAYPTSGKSYSDVFLFVLQFLIGLNCFNNQQLIHI